MAANYDPATLGPVQGPDLPPDYRDARDGVPPTAYRSPRGSTTSPEETGFHVSSLLPLPANLDPTDTTIDEDEHPTDSHALARDAAPELVGAAQADHAEPEINDLGWNKPPAQVQNLVGGLPNAELWTLIRRFNKQMYHVKRMKVPPPGGLDLNIADQEEFSPDKLRANIERLYMTVIVGTVNFYKHIARLRSWNERKRTMTFAGVYAVAWLLDLLAPVAIIFFLVLLLDQRSRAYMFPPAPIALVDTKTGGLQEPAAGMLGSKDSLTGAPEKHQGEAVEQEASNFVTGFATITLASAVGKHHDEKDESVGDAVPDPTKATADLIDSKQSAEGDGADVRHDKTKQPVQDAMWAKMRPIMHIIGDICDGWERFGNALSPTPPFPQKTPRYRLAGLLAPALLPAFFVNSYMLTKGLSAVVGFAFFGQPLIIKGVMWLNTNYPHWEKVLEMRNTILKGVPTNAQLTITLLRMGEANKAPLPYVPPPKSSKEPTNRPVTPTHEEDYDLAGSLNASPEDLHAAIHPDLKPVAHPVVAPDAHAAAAPHVDHPPKKKHGFGAKLLHVFKGTTKASVESALKVDNARAVAGSAASKNRLGVVVPPERLHHEAGPVEFKCRYKGKPGVLHILTTAATPSIAFSFNSATENSKSTIKNLLHIDDHDDVDHGVTGETHHGAGQNAKIRPVFAMQIDEITEVKKVGGLGFKSKLVVGWATDRTITDGMDIVAKRGQKYSITACEQRDELYNRMISMGNQRWESW